VSTRQLHRRLGKLAANSSLRRCACGAYLPPELAQPRRIEYREEYTPPEPLASLLPLATDDEKRELQDLLNRCLELSPDLSQRRGSSFQIWGGEPTEAPLLRFRFTGGREPGPCCPQCGARVIVDTIQWLLLPRPAPDGLFDLMQRESHLAARFGELTALLRQRGEHQV
jgi:hypothetical protein